MLYSFCMLFTMNQHGRQCFICIERAKLECDGVELTSDIGSLKRLADKKILKPAAHRQCWKLRAAMHQLLQAILHRKGLRRPLAVRSACLLQSLRPFQHCSMCCRGLLRCVAWRRDIQSFVVGVQLACIRRKLARQALHALGHGAHPGRDWIEALVLRGVQGRERG